MITSIRKQQELTAQSIPRKLPIGAEVVPGLGVHFRVWSPLQKKMSVVLEDPDLNPEQDVRSFPLAAEAEGYFSGIIPEAAPGTLYRYQLDNGERYPDPASRFQPQGPHGPSQVVDSSTFRWTDQSWPGVDIKGQVIYEMHIGTFTPEGTWQSAAALLDQIAAVGITVLEIMPIADFPGRFGWGYDGVDFFAPSHLYGTPDDARNFVNKAHAAGLGVVLDVVYNHQGPDGSYLHKFSGDYFTNRYKTEWGSAFNFDGDNSGPVREFILANARCWVDEFHMDGLRIDATQSMFDRSREHILTAVTREVRDAARNRATIVVAESEPQYATLALAVEKGGSGMDGLWNDDFHHTARVAATGITGAYYADYRGTPQEFISAVKWGYLFQGQYYEWQHKKRGTSSLWLKPENFIIFIQNHDQISNSGRGQRIHQLTSPGRYRALTALLLLIPGTPMLFQGQEFAASSPFLYFADHKIEISRLVKQGRKQFLAQFENLAAPEVQAFLADPVSSDTFLRCKLDFSDRERNRDALALHTDLIRIRREDPVFRMQQCRGVDGAVLGPEAFVLRFFEENGNDRLLIVNLGRQIDLRPAPEPLLAPPEGGGWDLFWSSEDLKYGGSGTAPVEREGRWHIPAQAAVVMKPG